ncbi:uncharacterized protein LOC128671414 [Plodia interpunctella]|uniref:uncharacterized protein LOC128671414 n=1 Tax=Plodia interpunctella TaxID=58824 RepID=UPI002367FB0A|nr:uncharacterized protein LOC128671414 [Plodia interpunctella]
MRAIFSLGSILLMSVACTTFGLPASGESSPTQNALVLRQQQLDIIGNTRRLIEQLVENLQKAAKEAMDAVAQFRDGILEQAKLIQERMVAEIQKLKERVDSAFQTVYDKFVNSGQEVRECIDKQKVHAESVFNDTMKDTIACADERIKDIAEQLDSLTSLATNASEFANAALDDMRACIDKNQPSMMTVGACLGSVALRTEMRGAVFLTQSGLQIGRLNLQLSTLPAALEVCAGTRLVQAGVATARLIMEIGSCSASSIFTSFVDSTALMYLTESKNLIRENHYLRKVQLHDDNFNKAQEFSRMLEVQDQRNLRSLSDLWESIKNTAVNTWNHIKNIANKTKEKIKEMIEQFKDKINQIQTKFEERIKELQGQIQEMIDKAISTGQNVKKCAEEEKEVIGNLTKEILKNVSLCVSENLKQLSLLELSLRIEFDDTDFQNKLKGKLDKCVERGDVNEECLYGVREDLFNDVDAMENEFLQSGAQTRSVAEDILNTIIACTTEGLLVASANITMEAITIIKCAAEDSETTDDTYMTLE